MKILSLSLSLLLSSQFALAKVVTVGDFISGGEPISLENTQSLIDQGATHINAQNHQGETLLHRAVLDSDTDSVNLLIESGANINVQDKNGITPLHWAVYIGDKDSINLLVKAGADLNIQDAAGRTPFPSHVIHKINSVFGTLFGYRTNKPNTKPYYSHFSRTGGFRTLPPLPEHAQKDRQKREIGLNFKIEIKDKSSQKNQSSCVKAFQ